MTPILLIEIVSALVALICVIVFCVQLVQARRNGATSARPGTGSSHAALGAVLVIAALVHGVAATAYASGANALAYVFGWIALGLFVLSGLCVMPPFRAKIPRVRGWHIGLFVAGVVFCIAHAVAGRL